jgi:hypothetical protein
MKPQRLKLSRNRGFRLQKMSREINGLHCVVVARPRQWGNPFVVGGMAEVRTPKGSMLRLIRDQAAAVRWFEKLIATGAHRVFNVANIRKKLAGKNLACWCKAGACHGDTLLRIANEMPCQPASAGVEVKPETDQP